MNTLCKLFGHKRGKPPERVIRCQRCGDDPLARIEAIVSKLSPVERTKADALLAPIKDRLMAKSRGEL